MKQMLVSEPEKRSELNEIVNSISSLFMASKHTDINNEFKIVAGTLNANELK